MIDEVQKLLDDYMAWLKDKTALRVVAQWVEITTPYLDRHNDYIQIYARKENGGFILTDDGYTIDDLEQSGCKLQSPKRHDLLRMTLNGFGVQLRERALEVHTSSDSFSLRKHNLVQAILAVNDLFYLAEPVVSRLFLEDVESWMELLEVRYTPRVKFSRKSGFDHVFDFVIPKSHYQPERIVQAINRPTREKAQAVAFAWIDKREVRPQKSKTYAFLNDSEQLIQPQIIDALRKYDVLPVRWSEREEVREELAA